MVDKSLPTDHSYEITCVTVFRFRSVLIASLRTKF